MLTVFAESAPVAASGAAAGAETVGIGGMIASMLPLILVFVVMYLIMIRPQRKKEKELKKQINAMKVGDKITTIGGICGKVSKIKDNFVIIETGNIGTQTEKSFIKFEKSAIKEVEQKLSN